VVLGPNSLAYFERMLGALDCLGVEPNMAQAITGTVNSYTIGFVSDEVARARALEAQGQSPDEVRAAFGPYVQDVLKTGDCPALARFIAEHHHPTADEAFEFGLDRLLDGIEGYLAGQ
jgi:hypothetical protein